MSFLGKVLGGGTKLLGNITGEVTGTNAMTRAARDAAQIQADAAREGQARFEPWFLAGQQALGAQGAMTGLQGPEAQAAAIAALQQGPEFAALMGAGERSILSNAAATGGLRGGNVQAALGQFAPMLLSSLINDQFGRLGGISGMGMQGAGAQAGLLQQQGAAQAGGTMAAGSRQAMNFQQLMQLLSMGAGFMGAGGFGGGGGAAPGGAPSMPSGGGLKIPPGFGF
jgi:hypothetical protein